jgi:hypothetical protein
MLVYHPAFDIYNCIFRMLQLLSYTKEEEIAFDKLRIWDFYLTFPSQVSEISFPADLKHLKEKIFRDESNPYEELSDPKGIFDRMQPYQLSAVKCLASYGFVDSRQLAKNKVKKTGKQIPEELLAQLNNPSVKNKNTIKLVTSDFVNLPLLGKEGLKARTRLLDFKYDKR